MKTDGDGDDERGRCCTEHDCGAGETEGHYGY